MHWRHVWGWWRWSGEAAAGCRGDGGVASGVAPRSGGAVGRLETVALPMPREPTPTTTNGFAAVTYLRGAHRANYSLAR
jgi:hypothetical protein